MIAGREIALANLTVLNAPPVDIVDAAAAAGFDAVTFRLVGGEIEPNPLVTDTSTRRETLARLRHHGIGVLDVDVVQLTEDADVEALAPALEAAAVLGARHVLVINRDREETRAAERFGEICEASARLGLRAVLEFLPFTSTKSVEQADRFVALAGHATGGVLVDPLHLRRSGGSAADVAVLVAANPGRYPYLQLCDGPKAAPEGRGAALYAEAVENRLAPGNGEFALAELLSILPGAPLSIECPVAAHVHLSTAERAQRVLIATRRLLEGATESSAQRAPEPA